jgi:hypothetical protein
LVTEPFGAVDKPGCEIGVDPDVVVEDGPPLAPLDEFEHPLVVSKPTTRVTPIRDVLRRL